ncbi:MAG: FecR domain-containing protein, partial [Proteobacteria bacterium]|nr:FecR domain-containing protein [Pseudomonadota bacterium]
MDSSADPANDLTPRSAGEWLIALRERPHDRQLRLRLDAWLAASAEHSRDWKEMNATWEALGAVGAVGAKVSDLPRRNVPRAPGRRALMAAAILLGLAVAIGRGPDMLLDLRADFTTGTAEVRTVKLEDGTQVSLGPHTAVDIAFSGNERRVRLARGEAFFVVASGNLRPFVV